MTRRAVLLIVTAAVGVVLYECAGPDDPLLSLVDALAVAAYGWWLTCLAVATASVLPGPIGRATRAVQALVVPAAVRQLLVGTLGVGIVLAPLTPAAAAPAGTTAAVLDPRGPDANQQSGFVSSPRVSAVLPKMNAPTPRQPATTPPRTVVVRPGDSLWSIAAARLQHPSRPAIAVEWPRWWAANRQLIGPNPDIIRPGQRLRPPTSRNGSGS
ncbi:hypothetical protein GCM10009765_39880 [Fodinicola feengrottensis]|uniref:LysM domain-containing protein n=1 Tax=Fodinicola feengrottensis TaxID=435914 RepID=A0ABN2HE41_9ACTN